MIAARQYEVITVVNECDDSTPLNKVEYLCLHLFQLFKDFCLFDFFVFFLPMEDW